MCGYLDINVAEKLKDTCCKVKGVKSFKDFMQSSIIELTESASKRGIKKGIKVEEAYKYLF